MHSSHSSLPCRYLLLFIYCHSVAGLHLLKFYCCVGLVVSDSVFWSTSDLTLLVRDCNAQYTPPTPTRRNCFVVSRQRRRCVHEFATTADGFCDANAQRSRRPWPSSQLPTGVFTPTSRRNCRQPVHTADATRLDSFVSSASAVCIGLKGIWSNFTLVISTWLITSYCPALTYQPVSVVDFHSQSVVYYWSVSGPTECLTEIFLSHLSEIYLKILRIIALLTLLEKLVFFIFSIYCGVIYVLLWLDSLGSINLVYYSQSVNIDFFHLLTYWRFIKMRNLGRFWPHGRRNARRSGTHG